MKICLDKRGRELIKTFIFYFYLHCWCCLDCSLPLTFYYLPPTSSFVFKLLGEHAISTFPSELSFTVTCIFANLFIPIKPNAGFDLIYLLLGNFINFFTIEPIRKGFLIINLFA